MLVIKDGMINAKALKDAAEKKGLSTTGIAPKKEVVLKFLYTYESQFDSVLKGKQLWESDRDSAMLSIANIVFCNALPSFYA